jgi:hypothetical protein
MTDLRVCHLYPDHLNIYADRGNIAVLRYRCERRGIGFEAIGCGPGDALPGADLYYRCGRPSQAEPPSSPCAAGISSSATATAGTPATRCPAPGSSTW